MGRSTPAHGTHPWEPVREGSMSRAAECRRAPGRFQWLPAPTPSGCSASLVSGRSGLGGGRLAGCRSREGLWRGDRSLGSHRLWARGRGGQVWARTDHGGDGSDPGVGTGRPRVHAAPVGGVCLAEICRGVPRCGVRAPQRRGLSPSVFRGIGLALTRAEVRANFPNAVSIRWARKSL